MSLLGTFIRGIACVELTGHPWAGLLTGWNDLEAEKSGAEK